MMWPDDKDIFDKYDKYYNHSKDFENNKSWRYPRVGEKILPDNYDYNDIFKIIGELGKNSISVKMQDDKIVIDDEEIDASDFEEVGKAVYKALAKKMLSE